MLELFLIKCQHINKGRPEVQVLFPGPGSNGFFAALIDTLQREVSLILKKNNEHVIIRIPIRAEAVLDEE